MAYLIIGLVVTLVTMRIVNQRDRRLRGGRVGGTLMVAFWPVVVGAWAFALVIAAGHVWLVRNGS